MKRWMGLLLVVAFAAGALVLVHRRRESGEVSPNAMLSMAADAQRDVLRAPMQMTRLSDEEETRIGDAMAERYEGSFRSPTDYSAVEREVQKVGGKLAVHAHRRLNYRFHLIPDEQLLNAFALPGGHVFIGFGLVRLMNTEDELASVLGHELEHIDHYHCAERVQVEAQMRKLQLGVIGELMQLPLSVFEAGYSKDQESEADREGILLAVEAGFSPYGAVSMFTKFDELHRAYVIHAGSPPEELSQLAIETLSGYFRSHPLPSERIAQAMQVIAGHHLERQTKQTPMLPEIAQQLDRE
ncbi:peptidase M48, Ste24p [Candidatus Koribacter versatilis Ellin345]|uniref:Peptidase M48, Ste24p n=1 Tax=Koribacter versatilis (strain Ellin345) TaxID=204669 RepID=Q1IU37_KORVE|nr:M48 family metallopeptidase [Candidatus Koribacter versatilis]ABF39613.1 peptidase M48, Ste24p [Candidatus Koribacter versatilis Ellin345]